MEVEVQSCFSLSFFLPLVKLKCSKWIYLLRRRFFLLICVLLNRVWIGEDGRAEPVVSDEDTCQGSLVMPGRALGPRPSPSVIHPSTLTFLNSLFFLPCLPSGAQRESAPQLILLHMPWTVLDGTQSTSQHLLTSVCFVPVAAWLSGPGSNACSLGWDRVLPFWRAFCDWTHLILNLKSKP